MALVCSVTIWALFCGFLLFPRLGLPRFLQRTAAALLAFELVAVLAYSYASDRCERAPCTVIGETTRTVAIQDLPALTVLLGLLALGTGVRRVRRGRQVRVTTRSR